MQAEGVSTGQMKLGELVVNKCPLRGTRGLFCLNMHKQFNLREQLPMKKILKIILLHPKAISHAHCKALTCF